VISRGKQKKLREELVPSVTLTIHLRKLGQQRHKLNAWGLISTGAGFCFAPQRPVQFPDYPASPLLCIEGSFPGSKRLEHETDHSPPFISLLTSKIYRATLFRLPYAFLAWCLATGQVYLLRAYKTMTREVKSHGTHLETFKVNIFAHVNLYASYSKSTV
jgi:hypothetical protein